MKKSPFIIVALSINILFLFLYVHKASHCMYEAYYIQKLHAQQEHLNKEKQFLMTQLSNKKNHAVIKEFVTEQLHMTPVSLTQIQKLSA